MSLINIGTYQATTRVTTIFDVQTIARCDFEHLIR
jgi:hypothetical protein